MEQGVDQLYRAAVEKMAKSPDSDVEKLRRAIARGSPPSKIPAPVELARHFSHDDAWGKFAFADLRGSGFIKNELVRLDWFNPDWVAVSDELTAVAGIEARSIVRLSLMDCSGAMPEIERRLKAFVTSAASRKPLASLLAHQKLMFAVVAATGEGPLLEEYARRATVALLYVRAMTIVQDDIAGMIVSAKAMVSKLCTGNVRDCAADATAMRFHPSRPILCD